MANKMWKLDDKIEQAQVKVSEAKVAITAAYNSTEAKIDGRIRAEIGAALETIETGVQDALIRARNRNTEEYLFGNRVPAESDRSGRCTCKKR